MQEGAKDPLHASRRSKDPKNKRKGTNMARLMMKKHAIQRAIMKVMN
ncbi:hypothetical protein BVRB_2g046610 [Beta vulgaris subsp. vulgaris]|nr:hypothetical protein BVRB_2g046610 [Beta vulgaris subsp. vulgaris]